ncbi:conserved Plasmodium protein, unknown function [Plasmodium relictum]|uniref:Uncharacterized protein n=1 Tax=Plasmodium relictum TaxID=85471 RepID=A0A1J1H741_PLARL|nr:conserved Plasmodium protein, unknown function [Plasmodium relictum]CRH00604.1 conserved Plasmodium protein, unknown function [Plasmodium relictum]
MNRRDNKIVENKNNICKFSHLELKNKKGILENNLKGNYKLISSNKEKNNGKSFFLSKNNKINDNNYSKQLNTKDKKNLITNGNIDKLTIKDYYNKGIEKKINKELFNTNFKKKQTCLIASNNRKSDVRKDKEIFNIKKNSSVYNNKRSYYLSESRLKPIIQNDNNEKKINLITLDNDEIKNYEDNKNLLTKNENNNNNNIITGVEENQKYKEINKKKKHIIELKNEKEKNTYYINNELKTKKIKEIENLKKKKNINVNNEEKNKSISNSDEIVFNSDTNNEMIVENDSKTTLTLEDMKFKDKDNNFLNKENICNKIIIKKNKNNKIINKVDECNISKNSKIIYLDKKLDKNFINSNSYNKETYNANIFPKLYNKNNLQNFNDTKNLNYKNIKEKNSYDIEVIKKNTNEYISNNSKIHNKKEYLIKSNIISSINNSNNNNNTNKIEIIKKNNSYLNKTIKINCKSSFSNVNKLPIYTNNMKINKKYAHNKNNTKNYYNYNSRECDNSVSFDNKKDNYTYKKLNNIKNNNVNIHKERIKELKMNKLNDKSKNDINSVNTSKKDYKKGSDINSDSNYHRNDKSLCLFSKESFNNSTNKKNSIYKKNYDNKITCNFLNNSNSMRKNYSHFSCNTSIISENDLNRNFNATLQDINQENTTFINLENIDISNIKNENCCEINDINVSNKNNKMYEKNNYNNNLEEGSSYNEIKETYMSSYNTNTNYDQTNDKNFSKGMIISENFHNNEFLVNNDIHFSKDENCKKGISIKINKCDNNSSFNNANNNSLSKKRESTSLSIYSSIMNSKHEKVKKGLTFEEMRRKSFDAINTNTHINSNLKDTNRDRNENMILSNEKDKSKKNLATIKNKTNKLLENHSLLKKRKLNENKNDLFKYNNFNKKKRDINHNGNISDNNYNIINQNKMKKHDFLQIKHRNINKTIEKPNGYDKLKYINGNVLNEKKNKNEYAICKIDNMSNDHRTSNSIKRNLKKDEVIVYKNINGIKKNEVKNGNDNQGNLYNNNITNNNNDNNKNHEKEDSQKDKEKKLIDNSEKCYLVNNNSLKKNNISPEEKIKKGDKFFSLRKPFNSSSDLKILNHISEHEINKKKLANKNTLRKNKERLVHINIKKNLCNKKELVTSNSLTRNILSQSIQLKKKLHIIKNRAENKKINAHEKNQSSNFMVFNDFSNDTIIKEKNKIVSIQNNVKDVKCSLNLYNDFNNLNNKSLDKNSSNDHRDFAIENCNNVLLEEHDCDKKKNNNNKELNSLIKSYCLHDNTIKNNNLIINRKLNTNNDNTVEKNSNLKKSYYDKGLCEDVIENENYKVENEKYKCHAIQDKIMEENNNLEDNSNCKSYYEVNSNESKKNEEANYCTYIINKNDQNAYYSRTKAEDIFLKKKQENEKDEMLIKITNNVMESKYDIKNKNMNTDEIENSFLIKNKEEELLKEKINNKMNNENSLKIGTESRKTQDFNKNFKTDTNHDNKNINSVNNFHTNVSFSKKKIFENKIMHESNKKKNSKNYVLNSFSHAKKKINPFNENNKNEIYDNKFMNLIMKPYDKINNIQEISSNDLLNENFTDLIKNKNNFCFEKKKKNINFFYNNKPNIEKNNENLLNRKSKDKNISEKHLSNMTELSSCKKRKIFNSCFSNFSNDVFSISNDCANNKLSKIKNNDNIHYSIKHENDKKILKYNYFTKFDTRKSNIHESNKNYCTLNNSFEYNLNGDNSNRSEDLSENYLSNNSEPILPNKKQIEDFISSVEHIYNNKNILKKENSDNLKNYSIKNEQSLFLDNYFVNSVKNTENLNKLTDFNDSLYNKLNFHFDENNCSNKKKKHSRYSSNSNDSTFSLNNDINKHNFNFLINSLISNNEEKEENIISKNDEENFKIDKNLFLSNSSSNDIEKTYINSYFSNKLDEEDKHEDFNYYTSKDNVLKNFSLNIDKNETEHICNDKNILKYRSLNDNNYEYKDCASCNHYNSNKDYNNYNDYNKDPSNNNDDNNNNNDYNPCNNNIEAVENKLKNMVFEYILNNKLNVSKNSITKTDKETLKKNVRNNDGLKINEFEDFLKEKTLHSNSKSIIKNINFNDDSSNFEKKEKCNCIICINSNNNDNNNNNNNDSTLTDYYQSDVNNNLKSNCIDDIFCDEKKAFNNNEYNFSHIKNLIQNISNLNNEENKKFYDNFISKLLNNQYEVNNLKFSENYNDNDNNSCECINNNNNDSINDYNYNNIYNNNNINDQIHNDFIENGLSGNLLKNLENYKLNEKFLSKTENINKREKKKGDENITYSLSYPYDNILKNLNINNLKNCYESKKNIFSNNNNTDYKADNINYENNFFNIQKELSLQNYINSTNSLQSSYGGVNYLNNSNNSNKEKIPLDDKNFPFNNSNIKNDSSDTFYNLLQYIKNNSNSYINFDIKQDYVNDYYDDNNANNKYFSCNNFTYYNIMKNYYFAFFLDLYKKTKNNLFNNFCQYKNKNSEELINLNKSIDDNLKGDIYNCINLNILNENILKIHEIEKHHLNEIKKHQLNENEDEKVNGYNITEKGMKENEVDIIKEKYYSQKKSLNKKDKMTNSTSKDHKIYSKNNKKRREDNKKKSEKEYAYNSSKKKNSNSKKKNNDFNFREKMDYMNEISDKDTQQISNFLFLDKNSGISSSHKILYLENKEKNKKKRSKVNEYYSETNIDKNILPVNIKKFINNSKDDLFKKINGKVINDDIDIENINNEEIISKDIIDKSIINDDILVGKIIEEKINNKDEFASEDMANSNIEKINENGIINKEIISKEKIINENTINDDILVEKINDGKLISKEIINELIMMKEDLIQNENDDSNLHIEDINKLNSQDKSELDEINLNRNKLNDNILNKIDINENNFTENYNNHIVEAEKLNSDIPYITDIYKEMHKSPVMPLRIEAFHSLEDQRLIYGKPEWQKFYCPLCDKKYYPPNTYIKNYAHYLNEHWQNRKTLGGYIIFPCKLIHDIKEKTDTKMNKKMKKKKKMFKDPHYHCPLCLHVYFNDYNLVIDHCLKLHKSSGADPSRTLPSNLVHTPFINSRDYYSKLRKLESEVDIDISLNDNHNIIINDSSQNHDISTPKKQNIPKICDTDTSKKKNKNNRSSKVIFCDEIQIREFDIELSKIEKFGANIGPVFIDDQNEKKEKKENEKEEKSSKIEEKEKNENDEKNRNIEKIEKMIRDEDKNKNDEKNSNKTFENERIIEVNEKYNEIEVKKINKIEKNCEKKTEKKNGKNEIKKVEKFNEKRIVEKNKESTREKNNKINKNEINTKTYEKVVNKMIDKEQNENKDLKFNNKEDILASKKNAQYDNLNINDLENNFSKIKSLEKKETNANIKKINIKNKKLVNENINSNIILNGLTNINNDDIISKEEYNNNKIIEWGNDKNKLEYDDNDKLIVADTNKITYDEIQMEHIKNEQIRNSTNKKNNGKNNNRNKVFSTLFSIDKLSSNESGDNLFSCVNYEENLKIKQQPINEILLENRIENSKEHEFTPNNNKIDKRIKNNIEDFHKKIISKFKRKIKMCAINEQQKESNKYVGVKFHENIYMPPENMILDFKSEKEKNILKKVIREKKKKKIVSMKTNCRQSARIKSKKNKKI